MEHELRPLVDAHGWLCVLRPFVLNPELAETQAKFFLEAPSIPLPCDLALAHEGEGLLCREMELYDVPRCCCCREYRPRGTVKERDVHRFFPGV